MGHRAAIDSYHLSRRVASSARFRGRGNARQTRPEAAEAPVMARGAERGHCTLRGATGLAQVRMHAGNSWRGAAEGARGDGEGSSGCVVGCGRREGGRAGSRGFHSAPTQTMTPVPGSSRSPVSSTSDTLKRFNICATGSFTPSWRRLDTLTREVTFTNLPGA